MNTIEGVTIPDAPRGHVPAESIHTADGQPLIVDGRINAELLFDRAASVALIDLGGIDLDITSEGDEPRRRDAFNHSQDVSHGEAQFVNPIGQSGHIAVPVAALGDLVHALPDANKALLHVMDVHTDSSTGENPAATGLTVSVEAAARRGRDSDPDGSDGVS